MSRPVLTLLLTISLTFGAGAPMPLAHAQLDQLVGGAQLLSGSLSQINSQQSTLNSDLFNSLQPAEAIRLNQQLVSAGEALKNVLRLDIQPCLAKSSIKPGTKGRKKSEVLGKKSCKGLKPTKKLILLAEDVKISCTNAKDVFDTNKKQRKYQNCKRDQLQLLSNSLSCFDGIEGKLASAASGLQQYITEKTQFTQGILDQIKATIRGHEESVKLIEGELNGPEGFAAKLKDLKKLVRAVDSALIAGAGSAAPTGQTIKIEDGLELPKGIGKRTDLFKKFAFNNVTGDWIKQVVGESRKCFDQKSSDCSAATGPSAGFSCYSNFVCAEIPRGQNSKDRFNRLCRRNQEVLGKIFNSISVNDFFQIRFHESRQSISDPRDVILAATNNIEEMKARFTRAIDRYSRTGAQFGFAASTVNVAGLKSLLNENLERCKDREIRLFQQALSSGESSNNPYRQSIIQYDNLRRALQEDLNQWLDVISQKMTDFRTQFTRVFNRELVQFKESCRGLNDVAYDDPLQFNRDIGDGPAQSLACIKILRNQLQNGIDGTGGEPPTTIQIPVLQQGIGPGDNRGKTVFEQCTGFQQCVNKLGNAVVKHNQEISRLKNIRISEAQRHDSTVKGVLTAVSGGFQAALKNPVIGLEAFASKINEYLGVFNISKRLVATKRDGESLKKDEDSCEEKDCQINGAPKDILEVMGNLTGLQKFEQSNVTEIQIEIVKKRKDRRKKRNQAGTLAAKGDAERRSCMITAANYKSIKIGMGECESAARVCASGLDRALSAMESIGRKGSKNKDVVKDCQVEDGKVKSATYRRCRENANDSDIFKNANLTGVLEARKQGVSLSDPLTDLETLFGCYEDNLGVIDCLMGEAAREPYGDNRHDSLRSTVDDMIQECKAHREDLTQERITASKLQSADESNQVNLVVECKAKALRKVDGLAQKFNALVEQPIIDAKETAGISADLKKHIDHVQTYFNLAQEKLRTSVSNGSAAAAAVDLATLLGGNAVGTQASYTAIETLPSSLNANHDDFNAALKLVSDNMSSGTAGLASLNTEISQLKTEVDKCQNEIYDAFKDVRAKYRRRIASLDESGGKNILLMCESITEDVDTLVETANAEVEAAEKVTTDSDDDDNPFFSSTRAEDLD